MLQSGLFQLILVEIKRGVLCSVNLPTSGQEELIPIGQLHIKGRLQYLALNSTSPNVERVVACSVHP